MTTAQRILEANKTETFAQVQALQNHIRDLAVETKSSNCYDRTWTFYDGSTISKTRDGYTAGEGK